jgi:hypothetical protein
MTDSDRALTITLVGAMAADHKSRLGPDEVRPFLETVTSGNGLFALIRQMTDEDADWIDTATLLDPVEDRLDRHDVNYYLKLLWNAAQKTRVTRDELRALCLRNIEIGKTRPDGESDT